MKAFVRAKRAAPAPRGSAKQVQRAPARSEPGMRALLRAPPAAVQRACVECEEEKKVQRAAAPGAARGGDVSSTVAAGTASGGAPLPAAARRHFEPRFGHDFGGVRVHTGPEAAASADALSAHAYTFGNDIVFGAGAYNPETQSGRRLLAHELTHVVQQAPERVLRQPLLPQGGTKSLHDAQVEEYRRAHGLPPRGIDPVTGAQVGPTDGVIRFGGLLEAWLREKSGEIAAPAKAPRLVEAGTDDIRAGCKKETGGDENSEWYHYCRRHREFVVNVYPKAVENIRSVASPYSEAIAKLYASALPWTRLYALATPKRGEFPLELGPGFPGPLRFGATTHTFNGFTLELDQSGSDVVAEQFDPGGGATGIRINEMTTEVQLKDMPAIESAMVHEAMHAFSRVVEANNTVDPALAAARRLAGLPALTPVDLNLDVASYGRYQADLEAAVLPFVRQIHQLPSLVGRAVSAELDAEFTARKMIRETMARVEEAIYVRQRSGAGFTSANLTALEPFHTYFSYWEPRPPVASELETFLTRNKNAIDAKLRPLIVEVGARYLSLRPRPKP